MWGRRSSEASERFAERREREDSAPRLAASVPTLESLKLEISESTGLASSCPEAEHIRRIVVEHAPALFFIRCHDSYCKDGGHDITHGVLQALRRELTQFGGDHPCPGHVGSSDCQRVLHYSGTATYRAASPK